MKAEPSRLIPRKPIENLELLFVSSKFCEVLGKYKRCTCFADRKKIIQVLGSLQRCSVDGRLLLVVKSYSCSEVCVRVNSMN